MTGRWLRTPREPPAGTRDARRRTPVPDDAVRGWRSRARGSRPGRTAARAPGGMGPNLRGSAGPLLRNPGYAGRILGALRAYTGPGLFLR